MQPTLLMMKYVPSILSQYLENMVSRITFTFTCTAGQTHNYEDRQVRDFCYVYFEIYI